MYEAASNDNVGKLIFEDLFPMFLADHGMALAISKQDIENETRSSNEDKPIFLLNEISIKNTEEAADLIADFIDIFIQNEDYHYADIFTQFKDSVLEIHLKGILCEIIKRSILFSDQKEYLYNCIFQIDLVLEGNIDLNLLACTLKYFF